MENSHRVQNSEMSHVKKEKNIMELNLNLFQPTALLDSGRISLGNTEFPLNWTKSELDGSTLHQLSIINLSEKPIRIHELGWSRSGVGTDFLYPGKEDIDLYVEGWQMASPSGVRHYGDRDFEFNPEYRQFAVADEADYSDEPNHFRSECMITFHHRSTGENLLIGFVTSAEQYGRFRVVLGSRGVDQLDIISSGDGRELKPGETMHSEKVVFLRDTDTPKLFNRFAEIWGKAMNAHRKLPLPRGWCSWYYFFRNVTAADVVATAEFAARHADTIPMRIIQVDSGYQRASGDWLVANEKFPGGLQKLAADIRSYGFVPGVWFDPFVVEEQSLFYHEHPECVIRNPQGEPIPLRKGEHHDSYFALDGTHPASLEFLQSTFSQIRAWGVDYLKLDFLDYASLKGGVLYDREATRAQALRRGLEAIRAGFGDDGFICCCTAPFGPCVGIADSVRVATDYLPAWNQSNETFAEAPTTPNVCRNIVHRTYMNHHLFWTDPDTLLLRDTHTKLSAEENELWYHISRLTGGAVLLGDNIMELSPEALASAGEMLKNPDAYEAFQQDLWESAMPGVIEAKRRSDGEREVWLFNLKDQPQTIAGELLPPHTCRKK